MSIRLKTRRDAVNEVSQEREVSNSSELSHKTLLINVLLHFLSPRVQDKIEFRVLIR